MTPGSHSTRMCLADSGRELSDAHHPGVSENSTWSTSEGGRLSRGSYLQEQNGEGMEVRPFEALLI